MQPKVSFQDRLAFINGRKSTRLHLFFRIILPTNRAVDLQLGLSQPPLDLTIFRVIPVMTGRFPPCFFDNPFWNSKSIGLSDLPLSNLKRPKIYLFV